MFLLNALLNQYSFVGGIFWWSNQKKTQKWAELYCRTSNIYIWLQTLWSSQIEKSNYISYFIMISNMFEYQYNFIFHLSMGSKKHNIWKKLEIFMSNRAFSCRTSVIIHHLLLRSVHACLYAYVSIAANIYCLPLAMCVKINNTRNTNTWLMFTL